MTVRQQVATQKQLPEDTEVLYCFFCRKWHGLEVFCFGNLHRWLRIGFYIVQQFCERWLERAAYAVAIFALACFAIALVIALAGLLPG